MPDDTSQQQLQETRRRIALKIRELRLTRRLTQEDLAGRLRVSQGHFSELERGSGSFTAEQFLTLLRIFNVPASDFGRPVGGDEPDLQNALARLGASHLHESADVVPGERFEDLTIVLRETLIVGSPRLITALAPVIVDNLDRLPLRKALSDLTTVGLERRFAWTLDNTVDAIRRDLAESAPGPWGLQSRRANAVLSDFLVFLGDHLASSVATSPDDVLDRDIGSPESLAAVRRASSQTSRRWHIVSALHPDDFLESLRAARATR